MSSTTQQERFLEGAAGSPGIVIGKSSLYQREQPRVSEHRISADEVEQQVRCFKEARKKAEKELQNMLESQQGGSAVELVQTQIEMINDPELNDQVIRNIKENKQPADLAVKQAFENYLQVIRQTNEQALERSVDIADVRDRLIQILHNHRDEIVEDRILVAHELSPREVIEFSSRNVKGIIMDSGGTTSHAAIIARSMNIPTIVGVKNATEVIEDGQQVILDGGNGEGILHPNEATLKKYEQLIEQQVAAQANFESICQDANETTDGHPFSLRANLEFSEGLTTVQKYRAEGIGLLRTESIYLSRENFRNQDHQQKFYESILELTSPHPVTIRLFDSGGDKFFGDPEDEQNPFLGWRGIRMLLDEKQLLRNQLRAILKTAANYKDRVRILIPMISTLQELLDVKELVRNEQKKLSSNGIDVDKNIQIGIMVEVPSVALQAELYAQHADFLSIGTNDLAQYVLAVDRGNERIADLYDQRHPAIWQLIKQVAEAADQERINVSLCGELASNPIAACCLVGMGITDLSMNAVVLPRVKEMLCGRSLSEMQELSQQVLQGETIDDINRLFSNWKSKVKQ